MPSAFVSPGMPKTPSLYAKTLVSWGLWKVIQIGLISFSSQWHPGNLENFQNCIQALNNAALSVLWHIIMALNLKTTLKGRDRASPPGHSGSIFFLKKKMTQKWVQVLNQSERIIGKMEVMDSLSDNEACSTHRADAQDLAAGSSGPCPWKQAPA